MLWIILFIIYILLILTVLFVERKSPTDALLWVLIMIIFPYAGAILYLIFGSTISIKITSYVRKKRLSKRLPTSMHQSIEHLESLPISEADKQVISFNKTYNESKLTCYENIHIYTTGKSHYEQLFQDINHAKTCIYIEFYTIHHDLVGEALCQALEKKAREGVKVLVMCDFIANLSTPQKMFKPLIQAGGEVIRIKPYLTHYRSHRKIVVIDHQIGYIGGMNIGKQYANLAKVKNPWRDTQVRVTGHCAGILDEYFLTDWLCSIRKKQWENTISYVSQAPDIQYNQTSNLCQFIVGGVDNSKEGVKMCYLSMIRSAKKHIRIQTPYFIPDTSILDALKTAAAAGVEIDVMVPGIKASFFLDPLTNLYCGKLMEYGAKIHKYEGYIHAKTMTIDDELCCFGSVNMDMRSLKVDDEICGVFYQNDLVSNYIQTYYEDLKHTKPYTYDMFMNRSKKERVLESIFFLFAPLM